LGNCEQKEKALGLVLAGGKGTRFARSVSASTPKVLQPVLGKPLISYVLDTLREAGISRIIVVVGYGGNQVRDAIGSAVDYAYQDTQLGSGHAVMCALESFKNFEGPLVVMCGDSPLFKPETIRNMLRKRRESLSTVVLASALLENPTGYGRIIRDDTGKIIQIVEESCADDAQRQIREVNGGAYVFWAPWLVCNIHRISKNAAGEYNLTDAVRLAIEQGNNVNVVRCEPDEIIGVNTPDDLQYAETILRRRGL